MHRSLDFENLILSCPFVSPSLSYSRWCSPTAFLKKTFNNRDRICGHDWRCSSDKYSKKISTLYRWWFFCLLWGPWIHSSRKGSYPCPVGIHKHACICGSTQKSSFLFLARNFSPFSAAIWHQTQTASNSKNISNSGCGNNRRITNKQSSNPILLINSSPFSLFFFVITTPSWLLLLDYFLPIVNEMQVSLQFRSASNKLLPQYIKSK